MDANYPCRCCIASGTDAYIRAIAAATFPAADALKDELTLHTCSSRAANAFAATLPLSHARSRQTIMRFADHPRKLFSEQPQDEPKLGDRFEIWIGELICSCELASGPN